MALAGRKFRVILVGMVVALLVAAGPAGAQTNVAGNQYTEKVCEAVINIILDGSANQNAQIDQYVNGDNLNDIAQELNISPNIVQQCAREGGVDVGGDDNGGDDTNGTTDEGTSDEETNGTTDADGDGIPDDVTVVPGSIPGKNLPVTGGLELWAGGALLLGAGLLIWRVVHRR